MRRTALDNIELQALREQIGQERFDMAQEQLAAGKVIERTYFPNGTLFAFWDESDFSPEMHVNVEGNNLYLSCTCTEFGRSNVFGCRHLDGLLLAWIRDPGSFEVAEIEDEEDLFDYFTDLGLDHSPPSPGRETHSRSGSRPSAPFRTYDPVQEYQGILSELTIQELREVARRRGVTVTGQRKDPIVSTLAEALAQPHKLTEDWPKLSLDARRLAYTLPHYHPQYLQTTAIKEIGQSAGISSEQAASAALEELRHFGIAVITSYGRIMVPGLLWFWNPPDRDLTVLFSGSLDGLRIQPARRPREVLHDLARVLLLIQAEGDRYPARAATRDTYNSKLPFLAGWPLDQQDLMRVYGEKNAYYAMQTHRPRITAAPPLLQAASLERLAGALGERPEYVDWLMRILLGIGILELNTGRPARVQTPDAVSNLLSNPLISARLVLAYYAALETWTDLDLVLSGKHRLEFRLVNQTVEYDRFLSDLAAIRNTLMMTMSNQPAGEWIDVNGIVDLAHRIPIHRNIEGFDRYLQVHLAGKKLHLNQPADWKQFFILYLETVLGGPVFWQGLVDLAWKGDRLAAFRLSTYGSAVLNQFSGYQDLVEEAAHAPVSFSKDGAILVSLDAAGGELINLLSLLSRPELRARDQIIFRPDIQGAAQAFEAGWTLDRIQSVLQEASGGQPLPEPLSAALRTWWENFGLVQIYGNVALIELTDDYALNELLAGTTLSRYLLYRFNSRLVAIRPEGVEALQEEMLKKGYTPRLLRNA